MTAHPEVWDSLGMAMRPTATGCTHRPPTPRPREGQRPEGLSGSSGPGMPREKRSERGRPAAYLPRAGMPLPHQEDGTRGRGSRLTSEDSEGGRAVHRGKGVRGRRRPQRQRVPDRQGRSTQANLPEGTSTLLGHQDGGSESH